MKQIKEIAIQIKEGTFSDSSKDRLTLPLQILVRRSSNNSWDGGGKKRAFLNLSENRPISIFHFLKALQKSLTNQLSQMQNKAKRILLNTNKNHQAFLLYVSGEGQKAASKQLPVNQDEVGEEQEKFPPIQNNEKNHPPIQTFTEYINKYKNPMQGNAIERVPLRVQVYLEGFFRFMSVFYTIWESPLSLPVRRSPKDEGGWERDLG